MSKSSNKICSITYWSTSHWWNKNSSV